MGRSARPPNDSCTQWASAELAEEPGGGLALRNFSLHGEFTRDHMMAMAHNFVPSKPLPDAPSYTPLSSREKFEGWSPSHSTLPTCFWAQCSTR